MILQSAILKIKRNARWYPEFLRIVETENSKRKKKSSQEKKVERQKKQEVEQEVIKKVEVIREEKKKEKKKQHIQEKAKPKVILKVGDRVRLLDGKAVGTIDTIGKEQSISELWVVYH